jgi:DNA-binding transcriptional ArsR family regulator
LVEGLETFRREFAGRYWLEVMLLDGYTTLPPQVRQFADWVRRIRPDKVQLNTAVRPPAETYAMAVPPQRITEITRLFDPRAEVIADYHQRSMQNPSDASPPAILELLRRRPCTEKDLAGGLLMRPIEVAKHLAALEATGLVASQRRDGLVYYHVATQATSEKQDSPPAMLRRGRGSGESEPAGSRGDVSSARTLRRKRTCKS